MSVAHASHLGDRLCTDTVRNSPHCSGKVGKKFKIMDESKKQTELNLGEQLASRFHRTASVVWRARGAPANRTEGLFSSGSSQRSMQKEERYKREMQSCI